MKKLLLPLGIGVLMATAITLHAAASEWEQQLDKLTDEYFDEVYFHYGPTNGTLAGLHQYDGQLEDYSSKNIEAEIAALKKFEQRVDAIHPDSAAADSGP